MLTRSKLKLGELVETNPEIGRVYNERKMLEESPLESNPQFMDSFMTMRAMVEEMYREFKKSLLTSSGMVATYSVTEGTIGAFEIQKMVILCLHKEYTENL